MPPASQSVVVDLLVLVVQKSTLKDLVSPEEFRTRIGGDYAALTDGGKLKLQRMWDVFAPTSGFDAAVAACPICWVKSLEPRLGMPVDLPSALATLKSSEIATQAAKVFIKKDDVDRLLGVGPPPSASPRARVSTPPPGVRETPQREPGAPPIKEPGAPPLKEPGAAPLSPGRMSDLGAPGSLRSVVEDAVRSTGGVNVGAIRKPGAADPAREKLKLIIAAVVIVGAGLFLASTLRAGCAKPSTPFSLSALGDLPVKDGKRRGPEVSARLADAAWLSTPLDKRTAQLAAALEKLRPAGVETLVLLDANGQMVASVQFVAGAAKVRFYK